MSKYLLALILLVSLAEPALANRIVVLAPAAGDILIKLGLEGDVVGKTRSLKEFPQAQAVGSHIKPNVELVKALKPDLIIISSNRFFSEQMAQAVGAEIFNYNPTTLEQVILQVGRLGFQTGRDAEASELIQQLSSRLKGLRPISQKQKVAYEISAMPLSVAGSNNIVSDIIRVAGGEPLIFGEKKIIKLNPEAIIVRQPDLYLYQVGPMNRNPKPPKQRGTFALLSGKAIKVDQLKWSRANTQSFERVRELNKILAEK